MPLAAIGPVIGSALIGGGATIAGAAISANASKKATQAAQQAAADSNALQASIYKQNVGYLSPYVDRGNTAADLLQALYGLGGDPDAARQGFNKFLASTGYQFQVDQGVKAITGQQATAGLLNSGKTLKALTDYGQNTARSWFDNYASGVSDIAHSGLTAASNIAGVGTNYANAVSANNTSAAETATKAAIASSAGINNLLSAGLSAFRGLSSYSTAPEPQAQPAAPYRPLVPSMAT